MRGKQGRTAQSRRRRRGGRRLRFGGTGLTESFRALAGNRSLLLLVLAFSALSVAEWSYVTALAVDAFRKDGAVAVGLVGFRLFVAAVGSVFNVRYVERHPSGRALTVIAGARAGLVAISAALAAASAPLALLLVLLAIDAFVSSPYRPAQSALIPSLARTPKEVVSSAAAMSTVKTLGQALGAIAGGFLLSVVAPAAVFAGSAAVFVVAGALTVPLARRPLHLGTGRESQGIRDVLRQTLAVARHPHVGGILLVSGLRTFVRGMWLAIAVIASLRLLHAGSTGVGLLMLAAGIGALAAVPISAGLITRSRLGTPAALALVTCGFPIALIAGVPVLDVAFVLVVVWGIGMAVADVTTLSLLYRVLDSPLLPRAIAAIESAKLALEGIGAVLAPVLVDALGIRGALIVAGLLLPLAVLSGWRSLHRLDTAAGERTDLLALLHAVPFLRPLDMASLESVASRLVQLAVPGGTDVIVQGGPGDRFFVVRRGRAVVLVDGFEVGSVGAGGYFGEKALLRDVARTATVRSIEPMLLLALSREDFLTAVTGQAGAVVRAGLQQPVDAPADWDRRTRAEVLSRLSLFSHLDAADLRQLADRCVIDTWPEGFTMMRQGDEGDRFFVLLGGRARVSVDGRDVNELLPGDQFGEIALLHGVPRRATVTTASPAVTLSLHHDDFLPAVRSQLLLG